MCFAKKGSWLGLKMIVNNVAVAPVCVLWHTTTFAGHVSQLSITTQLGGCPFNGPLSVMKYPTRESSRRDAASPIKYNGLRVPQPSSLSHCAQPVVPYRNLMD